MPKIVFTVEDQLVIWVQDFVKSKESHSAYQTPKDFSIIPKKSTRPIIYAQIENSNPEKVIKELEAKGVKVYQVKYVVWDIER